MRNDEDDVPAEFIKPIRKSDENRPVWQKEAEYLRNDIAAVQQQVVKLRDRLEHVVASIGIIDTDIEELKTKRPFGWNPPK